MQVAGHLHVQADRVPDPIGAGLRYDGFCDRVAGPSPSGLRAFGTRGHNYCLRQTPSDEFCDEVDRQNDSGR